MIRRLGEPPGGKFGPSSQSIKTAPFREPLQYILGTQGFMGFSFRVDPRALIPRNDTETLCEEALRTLQDGDRVLDLCTGSGAIAIALKKLRPGCRVGPAGVLTRFPLFCTGRCCRPQGDENQPKGSPL